VADKPTLTHGRRQIARRGFVVVGLRERDAPATAGETPAPQEAGFESDRYQVPRYCWLLTLGVVLNGYI